MIWAVFSYSSRSTMNFCLSANCCCTALLSTALAYSRLNPKFMKLTSSTLTLNPWAFSNKSFLIYLLIFSLNFNNWSASSEISQWITLSDNGPKHLLADGVKDFFFIVSAEQLMDSGQMLSDRLLQNSQRNSHSLQIFSTSDHVNINRSESAVVNNGSLTVINT